MTTKLDDLPTEELIEYIKHLEEQLNSQKYGLYFDRKAIPETIVKECSINIPVLIHEPEKDLLSEGVENLLIEGDNYATLVALNMLYPDGLVDIIYIDPPYNTGNKDFQYNDKFVDDEDGYKHTKWLNFMEARLTLAKEILKDDGIIYISIDEHEFAQLKLLCDKIFGESNFVENFIWIKNSTKNLSKTTSTNHEYILCFAKNINIVEENNIFRIKKPGLDEVYQILDYASKQNYSAKHTEDTLKDFYSKRKDLKGISMYNMVDISHDTRTGEKVYKVYTLDNLAAPKATGKAETYNVIHPITKKPCKVPVTGWRLKQSVMEERIKNGLIYFYDDETHVPRFKRFLDTVESDVMKSIIENYDDGKKELMRIFGGDAPFSNSKPVSLIKYLLQISCKDATVLDFFAGSGTTAQAVLELNKEDGGNRRFILCTNNENNIMTDVCYPRIKTVLTGIRPDGSKYSEGLSGNLRYFKVGFINNDKFKEQARYNLVESCDGLICVLEETYELVCNDSSFSVYTNVHKNKCTAIFKEDFNQSSFSCMLEEVKVINASENIVYYFSQDNNVDPYVENVALKEIPNVQVKPIPAKMYEIYKRISDQSGRAK